MSRPRVLLADDHRLVVEACVSLLEPECDVVGIVTDRDVRDASPSVFEAASGRHSSANADPDRVPISDVMTRKVLSVGSQSSIPEAARIMQRERIGALPVLDGSRLVGILTRSDLLRALVALTDLGPRLPADARTVR